MHGTLERGQRDFKQSNICAHRKYVCLGVNGSSHCMIFLQSANNHFGYKTANTWPSFRWIYLHPYAPVNTNRKPCARWAAYTWHRTLTFYSFWPKTAVRVNSCRFDKVQRQHMYDFQSVKAMKFLSGGVIILMNAVYNKWRQADTALEGWFIF